MIIDYYNYFSEIDRLKERMTLEITNILQIMLVSFEYRWWPHFRIIEYQWFSGARQFKQRVTNSYYSQFNVKAENAVKQTRKACGKCEV